MKKMFRSLMLFSFLALAFTSCSEDNEPPAEPSLPGKWVKRIEVSDKDFQVFEFNNAREVSQYVSQWQSAPSGEISRFQLSNEFVNGKLVRAATQATRVVYTYEGNNVASAVIYTNNDRKFATHYFKYNTGGRLVEVLEDIAQPDPDGASGVKILLSYYGNGNLKQMEYQYRKTGETTFKPGMVKYYETYDDKPNPVKASILEHFLPGLVLQYNNPLIIRTESVGSADKTLNRFAYKYDENGYPLERSNRIEVNGNLSTIITGIYFY
ncbi:hypothetical protein KJS94_15545 [Flavihumibacter rivuli]|uniref:hypothetical protein n=1 Tax=Flavihumibacter rivuli TaxID=2838156 RepID=UPI001BDF229C|nr:hypothetical protein [Flavihumibacter rivuli]ULQ56062.1 hypothetical protein KJS94_15545 [Flavihumibacter rivuli]